MIAGIYRTLDKVKERYGVYNVLKHTNYHYHCMVLKQSRLQGQV